MSVDSGVASPSAVGSRASQRAPAAMHRPTMLLPMRAPRRVTATMRARSRERQRRERQRRLTAVRPQIFRSYRKGELPDVQVPYSGVYGPLATLCRLDTAVAGWFLTQTAGALLAMNVPQGVAATASASRRGGSQSQSQSQSQRSQREMSASTVPPFSQTLTQLPAEVEGEGTTVVPSFVDATFQSRLVEAVHGALALSRGDVATTSSLLRICNGAIRARGGENGVVHGITRLYAAALQLAEAAASAASGDCDAIVQRIKDIGTNTFGARMWAGHERKDGVLRVERAAIDCFSPNDAELAKVSFFKCVHVRYKVSCNSCSQCDWLFPLTSFWFAKTKEWLELSTVWNRALPGEPSGAVDERDHADFAEDLVGFCKDVPGALQPRLITRAALASGAFHAAVPILEWVATRFTSGGVDGGEALRCPRAPVWAELARVYAALGEHDARLAVLAQSTTVPSTMRAVQLEESRDLMGALELYVATTESGVDASHGEQMMWYNGRLRCLRALRKWEDVHEEMRIEGGYYPSVDGDVEADPNWSQNLWKPSVVDTAVPLYVNALLRLSEEGDEAESFDTELRKFVDESNALSAPRREWLADNVATLPLRAHLAVTSVPGDYAAATAAVGIGYDKLLARVASLHPLASAAQARLFQTLHQLADTDDAAHMLRRGCATRPLHAASSGEPLIVNRSLRALLLRWVPSLLVEAGSSGSGSGAGGGVARSAALVLQSRMPSSRDDPPQLWQDVADARSRCLVHIDRELVRADFADDSVERLAVAEVRVRLKIAAAAGLTSCGTVGVARAYLRDAKAALRRLQTKAGDALRSDALEFAVLRTSVAMRQHRRTRGRHGAPRSDDGAACIALVEKHRAALCPPSGATDPAARHRARMFHQLDASALRTAARECDDRGDAGGAATRRGEAYSALSRAAATAPGADSSGERRDVDPLALSAPLAFALFCAEHLGAPGAVHGHSGDELASVAMTQLLRATCIGGSVGRAATERLPVALKLLHTHFDAVKAAWDAEISAVPCWVFVRWVCTKIPHTTVPLAILCESFSQLDLLLSSYRLSLAQVPQLVALLAQREGALVLPLLERIAEQYRGAVYWPYAGACFFLPLHFVRILLTI